MKTFAEWRRLLEEREAPEGMTDEQAFIWLMNEFRVEALEDALEFFLRQADRYRRNYATRLAVDAVVSSAENFRMWATEQGYPIKYKTEPLPAGPWVPEEGQAAMLNAMARAKKRESK